MSYFGSFLAGFLIGLGSLAYCCVEDKIIGALLFSFALCSIRIFNLDLYTGSLNKVFSMRMKWGYLPLIFCGNYIGATFCGIMTNLLEMCSATDIFVSKFLEVPYWKALWLAIICGVLMSIATMPDCPLWLTMMCVMVFILTGARHSVADCWYLGFSGNGNPGWRPFGIIGVEIIGNLIGAFLCYQWIALSAEEKRITKH